MNGSNEIDHRARLVAPEGGRRDARSPATGGCDHRDVDQVGRWQVNAVIWWEHLEEALERGEQRVSRGRDGLVGSCTDGATSSARVHARRAIGHGDDRSDATVTWDVDDNPEDGVGVPGRCRADHRCCDLERRRAKAVVHVRG